jgi:hypothetical protein
MERVYRISSSKLNVLVRCINVAVEHRLTFNFNDNSANVDALESSLSKSNQKQIYIFSMRIRDIPL